VPVDPHILAFTGVAALLTISPGPDMALMLRNVLRGGSRVVLPTALGTCTGLFAWGAMSSLGIAALLAASAGLYTVLRLAGAAYLVILGLLALRAAATGRHDGDPGAALAGAPDTVPGAVPVTAPGTMTRAAGFRSGLLTNLLNPKIGVFYATLLPQFIPPGAPPLATSLQLAGIHAALGIAWLCLYGGLLARAGDIVRRGRVRRVLEGLTGAVLVALGLRVALDAH
jgi:threonine/homoserine/homoserine lactone efflux protein